MGCKLLTSACVVETCTSLINTWNTLPESYQQRVYNNTPATVKHRIQLGENPTRGIIIRVEAAGVDNVILLDNLTCEVALEEPEIGSTDRNLLIDENCMDDELHFGMPGSIGDYESEGDKCDNRDAIPTASQQRLATTELQRFHLGSSDVNMYDGQDANDADAGEKEESSQAGDGSTQNVEDWGHSRFDLGTSDVTGCDGEDGDITDVNEEEDVSPADDASTQHV